jgi:hypothetical protein
MKNILSKALLITVCIVMLVSVVSAQPLNGSTTKSLSTKFTLANLGTATAHVTVDYYQPNGSAWVADAANTSFDITNNYSQKFVTQWDDTTLTSGTGSVVVSSDQPLASVVEIWARSPQVPTTGAYVGVTSGANTVVLPQVFYQKTSSNGIQNSQIFVQNVGTTTADVTIHFIPFPGSTGNDWTTSSVAIQPGATYPMDLADSTGFNGAWSGSAVVDAADAADTLAVTVNSFAGADAMQTYNGFSSAAATTTWYFPQFMVRLTNSSNTPITYTNVSGSTFGVGTVTLNCNAISTSYTPATLSLANTTEVLNNASGGWNTTSTSVFPSAPWSGSCTVSAPGNIVAFAQYRRPGVSSEFAAYEAFPASVSGTTWIAPVMAKRMPDGWATTTTVKNLDTANDAHVDFIFYRHPDCTVGDPIITVSDITILAGGSGGANLRTTSGVSAVPTGWYGAMVVAPNAGYTARQIIMNVQLTNYLYTDGDRQMMHDALWIE